MTDMKKEIIRKKQIGKDVFYESPKIHILMKWLKPKTKQDQRIIINDGKVKSIRCKIVDIYFCEKLIGNYIHFGYRPVLRVLRENRMPFQFYGQFKTVEKMNLNKDI